MSSDKHDDLDLKQFEEEYLRLRGELPPLSDADLRDPRVALTACQTWWSDWAEVAEEQATGSSLFWRRLGTLIAKTQLLAQVCERLGLDFTPLLSFLHEGKFSLTPDKALPAVPDELSLLLERMVVRLQAQIEAAAPAPNDEPEQPQAAVVLHGQGKQPVVLGKSKRSLLFAQYEVVQALLDAGEDGLTLNDLETNSRHTDARNILKRLAKSDPDWQAVIHFAGRSGGRYRIG